MVSFPIVFTRECSAITSYGKCFTLVSNPTFITWNQSKFECSEQDQSLASVLSQNEEGLIATAVPVSIIVWVGLNDIENEGQYVWVDGNNFTSVNWNQGYPQISLISNCVYVYNGQYAVIGCHYVFEWHLCTSTGE